MGQITIRAEHAGGFWFVEANPLGENAFHLSGVSNPADLIGERLNTTQAGLVVAASFRI